MRILLLAGSYPPETGGIAQFMHSFADGLSKNNVDVEVAANIALPPRGYLKRIETCRAEVSRRAARAGFDRIVASSWSPYAVALAEPFDVFCHGMDLLEPARSLRYRLVMKQTLKRASRILANSRYTANLATQFGARPERIVVLHPGVDSEFFTPASAAKASGILLSVGRLVERKGFDTVLKTLPRLLREFPALRYVCVGDGPDRKRLERLAQQLKIADHVEWRGEVGEEEKRALYQSADVFVMPNRHIEEEGSVEGFGIVFLEASACGIPVVGGNSGGTPDAVADGVTGYLVEPQNERELAARLSALLSDRTLAAKMGKAGRKRVLESFRADQIASRYLATVRS